MAEHFVMEHYFDNGNKATINYCDRRKSFISYLDKGYASYVSDGLREFVSRGSNKMNMKMREELLSYNEVYIIFYEKDKSTYFEVKTVKKPQNVNVNFIFDEKSNFVYKKDNSYVSSSIYDLPENIKNAINTLMEFTNKKTEVEFVYNLDKIAMEIH